MHLALYGVVAVHSPDDGTDAAHVEEEILADEAVVESVDLVPHGDRHVRLRGDVRLIRCHLQNVALVEVNLLVFVRLAEEEFGLLAELHDQHHSSLVLVRRLARPLH